MTKLAGAIIAAGRGERLRSSVADLPKPLVELGGDAMLARQARAMLAVGASPIMAVVNSETDRLMQERRPSMPAGLLILVRDTANSMESLFALGEHLAPGLFLLATVDAVVAPEELSRFVAESTRKVALGGRHGWAGVLAVTRWRGDKRPLFADVTNDGLIARLGGAQTATVTAGIYLLPTTIFAHADDARALGLDAMRRFLAMLIERGMRFGAIEIEGAIDVDEASDLAAARAAIRRQA